VSCAGLVGLLLTVGCAPEGGEHSGQPEGSGDNSLDGSRVAVTGGVPDGVEPADLFGFAVGTCFDTVEDLDGPSAPDAWVRDCDDPHRYRVIAQPEVSGDEVEVAAAATTSCETAFGTHLPRPEPAEGVVDLRVWWAADDSAGGPAAVCALAAGDGGFLAGGGAIPVAPDRPGG